MDISSEQSALIRKLIADYIIGSAPDPNNVRQLVAQKKVLPLVLDMGGVVTLDPGGHILSFLWDDTEHPRLESDPRIRNVALFQGSKKYPELKDLLPAKPDDARICPSCGGTGIDPAAAKLDVDNIVCYCGGLGWIP